MGHFEYIETRQVSDVSLREAYIKISVADRIICKRDVL